MTKSFFSRLASYSQNPQKLSLENFLTEVLAHLLNTDPFFRRTFIRLIIPDRRKQRPFASMSALPQQTIGRGIVDLVLTGNDGRKVLVELKIKAKETQTKIRGHGKVLQIQKYLNNRTGMVAYLTTRNIPSPEVNSRYYLGHFLLEQLEGRLKRDRLTATGQLLLDFMREHDMKSLERFTKMDLRNAENSFRFAQKCEATIDEVVGQIESAIKKMFRVRTSFTSAHFSPLHNSAYCYTHKFRYGEVRYLSVFLSPWETDLGFGISAKVPKKDIDKIKQYIDWDEDGGEIYSWHVISPNTHPSALAKMALTDARNLRSALNHTYYNRR